MNPIDPTRYFLANQDANELNEKLNRPDTTLVAEFASIEDLLSRDKPPALMVLPVVYQYDSLAREISFVFFKKKDEPGYDLTPPYMLSLADFERKEPSLSFEVSQATVGKAAGQAGRSILAERHGLSLVWVGHLTDPACGTLMYRLEDTQEAALALMVAYRSEDKEMFSLLKTLFTDEEIAIVTVDLGALKSAGQTQEFTQGLVDEIATKGVRGPFVPAVIDVLLRRIVTVTVNQLTFSEILDAVKAKQSKV